MPDDDFEPRRPASGPTGDLFPQLLVEGLARAIRPAASESPNRDAQLDDPPMGRQIQQATPITAVYPVGFLSAGRAHRDGSPAASVDQDPLGSDLHVVDHETARRERLEDRKSTRLNSSH